MRVAIQPQPAVIRLHLGAILGDRREIINPMQAAGLYLGVMVVEHHKTIFTSRNVHDKKWTCEDYVSGNPHRRMNRDCQLAVR